MEYNTFKKGMGLLVKAFPEKENDYDLMWEFLQDLEDEDFIKAISKIVITTKDINRATNMIALIRESALPENILAGEAWAEVLKEISKTGSWGKPQFNDPLIVRAVECIGWKNMCMSENIAIERAHFLKVFDSLSARNRIATLTVSHDVKKLISSVVENLDQRIK